MAETSGAFPMPFPNTPAIPDVPADIQALAQRVTDRLVGSVYTFRVANAAARTALTNQRVGDKCYQTDVDLTYLWDGAQWNAVLPAGFVKIRPATIANSGGAASASTSGTVTFSGVSSVSLNGVFTNAFQSYVVGFNIPSTSTLNVVNARLRAGGSDNTAADYDRTNLNVAINSTSTVVNQQLAQTSWEFSGASSLRHIGEARVYSPSAANETRATGQFFGASNPMSTAAPNNFAFRNMLHRASTAFDGITLLTSTGNMTGEVVVYGYA